MELGPTGAPQAALPSILEWAPRSLLSREGKPRRWTGTMGSVQPQQLLEKTGSQRRQESDPLAERAWRRLATTTIIFSAVAPPVETQEGKDGGSWGPGSPRGMVLWLPWCRRSCLDGPCRQERQREVAGGASSFLCRPLAPSTSCSSLAAGSSSNPAAAQGANNASRTHIFAHGILLGRDYFVHLLPVTEAAEGHIGGECHEELQPMLTGGRAC
ncbi:hypothetical protein KIL84_006561 [Mauremys mutica]|uniref:Uncharacterized protein n=1 Tax=Mauremys mutica TaxID=74926 RepID=A0A9D3X1P2_9SAUR|nr:hypothetical protein KIL84_006561 [Mauremys mutica]